MSAELEVTGGYHAGQRLALVAGQALLVGRAEKNDLAFPDDLDMSRSHFSVEYDGTKYRLQDLNSSNGTFLNETRIAEAELRDGDQILAGTTLFVLHVERKPADQAANAGVEQQQQQALVDEDPFVRREALLAAAWTRQRWLLDTCRQAGRQPSAENFDALLLLAILGKPADLPTILQIGASAPLGPRRFQILGSFGHPQVIEPLLTAIAGQDIAAAVAAGAAFTKITGVDIASNSRATLPPTDGSEPDEFEQEFLDEATLPSAELAAAHWKKVKSDYERGTRWCRGYNLGREDAAGLLDVLDMESRWEASLRGRYEGTWTGGPADFERLSPPSLHSDAMNRATVTWS